MACLFLFCLHIAIVNSLVPTSFTEGGGYVLPSFELAAGGVAGRDHRRGVPTNYQDAYCIRYGRNAITAVVADGCSSGERSEVGAAIGVEMLTTLLHRQLDRGYPPSRHLLARVQRQLVSQLDVLAQMMGESLSEVVNRFMLFTLLGVIITEETAFFFALGDGVVAINGTVMTLEVGGDILNPASKPTVSNQPIYLAYALTGSELTDDEPTKLDFRIIAHMPVGQLEYFLLGTDGVTDIISRADDCLPGRDEQVGSLSQFWETDRAFRNRKAVTMRLNLMARDVFAPSPGGGRVLYGGLLGDDTTLVVGRRAPAEQED